MSDYETPDDVRWIVPGSHPQPLPAWQDADGQWVIAGLPRAVPIGTRTYERILEAAPQPDAPLELAGDAPLRDRVVASVRGAWPAYAALHGRRSHVPPVRPDGNTAALIDLAVDTALRAVGLDGTNAPSGVNDSLTPRAVTGSS